MAELSVERGMYRPLNAAGRATISREQADRTFGRKDRKGGVEHIVCQPAHDYNYSRNGNSVLSPPDRIARIGGWVLGFRKDSPAVSLESAKETHEERYGTSH